MDGVVGDALDNALDGPVAVTAAGPLRGPRAPALTRPG